MSLSVISAPLGAKTTDGQLLATRRFHLPPGESLILWLTGLSSAGKSTLGEALQTKLLARGWAAEILDGDVVRRWLCKDLGFNRADREENVRRVSSVAQVLARNGVIVIVCVIAPYRAMREEARKTLAGFTEVFVNAPLEVCQRRDVKGLYSKARAGEVKGLTGLEDPYEPPDSPEVECRTDRESIRQSVDKILTYLEPRLNQWQLSPARLRERRRRGA